MSSSRSNRSTTSRGGKGGGAVAEKTSVPSTGNTFSSAFLTVDDNPVIDLRTQPPGRTSQAEGGVRRASGSADSGEGSSSSSRTVSGAKLSEPPSTIPDVHAPGSRVEDAVPLTFVASTADSDRLGSLEKGRDMASQSEAQFDPSQPLPEGQLMWKQAYDLVRLLRQYTCYHPGVLGNMEALVPVNPIGDDATSSARVPPPSSNWPIPRLPLNTDWTGSSEDASLYRSKVYIYHLVNAAQEITRGILDLPEDEPLSFISIHLRDSSERILVECSEPPGNVVLVDALSDELDLDPAPVPADFPGPTLAEQREQSFKDLQGRQQARVTRNLVTLGRLATLNIRTQLTEAEAALRARSFPHPCRDRAIQ